MQQAIGELVEVVQPFAQVRVGLPHQFGARVALHPLDRRFRRQPRADRLRQAAQPAPIMRDHAETLQNFAMFARPGFVAAIDQPVDRLTQGGDRLLEPDDLAIDVLGDDLLHDDARLVQHNVPEPHALGHRHALERQGLAQHLRPGRRQRLQLAPRDHLGEQHGGRLEDLDLLLGIKPSRSVLHHEHAQGVAAAQDGHAAERLVDLLARLRLVGEGRVRLGVGKRQGLGIRRDGADDALTEPHGRKVDGFPVQPLRRVELEPVVGVEHVDRADLGDHVEGDLNDDLVEARLGTNRLGHDLAQPTQQQTRSAKAHQVGPLKAAPRGRVRSEAWQESSHFPSACGIGTGVADGKPHRGEAVTPNLTKQGSYLRPRDRRETICRARTACATCAPQARYRRRRSAPKT